MSRLDRRPFLVSLQKYIANTITSEVSFTRYRDSQKVLTTFQTFQTRSLVTKKVKFSKTRFSKWIFPSSEQDICF